MIKLTQFPVNPFGTISASSPSLSFFLLLGCTSKHSVPCISMSDDRSLLASVVSFPCPSDSDLLFLLLSLSLSLNLPLCPFLNPSWWQEGFKSSDYFISDSSAMLPTLN